MDEAPRSRALVRIVVSSGMSFVVLAVLNGLLPLWLGVEEFGRWRQIALVLTLAGVAHVGIAEGLYLWWISRPEAKISRPALLRNLLIAMATAAGYATLACWTGSVLWKDFLTVWSLVFAYAAYAMVLAFVQTHSEHPRYFSMFVMQPVGVMVLIVTLGVSGLATPVTTAAAMTLSYVIAGIYITVTAGLVEGERLRSGETLRAMLLQPYRGLALLGSGLLFVLVLNVDKFAFNHRFGHTEFASYSLLTVVPNALFSLAGPVGIVLFARGALQRRRRFAVLMLALGTILAGEIAARVLGPAIGGWYAGYQLGSLPWFTRWGGLILALALYYLPRLRVVHARTFNVSLAVYAATAGLLSAFVPANLAGSPIASVAAVNVALLSAWLVFLDLLDRRPGAQLAPDQERLPLG